MEGEPNLPSWEKNERYGLDKARSKGGKVSASVRGGKGGVTLLGTAWMGKEKDKLTLSMHR